MRRTRRALTRRAPVRAARDALLRHGQRGAQILREQRHAKLLDHPLQSRRVPPAQRCGCDCAFSCSKARIAGATPRHEFRIALLVAGDLVESARQRLHVARQMRPQQRRHTDGEILGHQRAQLRWHILLQCLERRAPCSVASFWRTCAQLLQHVDCLRGYPIDDFAEIGATTDRAAPGTALPSAARAMSSPRKHSAKHSRPARRPAASAMSAPVPAARARADPRSACART